MEEEGEEDEEEEEEEGVSTPKADAPKREDSVDDGREGRAANVPRDARGGGCFCAPPWRARVSPLRPCLARSPPRALALAAMPRMNSPAWSRGYRRHRASERGCRGREPPQRRRPRRPRHPLACQPRHPHSSCPSPASQMSPLPCTSSRASVFDHPPEGRPAGVLEKLAWKITNCQSLLCRNQKYPELGDCVLACG